MSLIEAIRGKENRTIAFVGAGGKTKAIFDLGKQVDDPVFVTTSTKISVNEKDLGDRWFEISNIDDLDSIDFSFLEGITVLTGPQLDEIHMGGLSEIVIRRLNDIVMEIGGVLLIEADGSKKKSLKAPLEHEPVIPEFVDLVVVTCGLGSIGKQLNDLEVHRPERFSELSGLEIGEQISINSVMKVILHGEGGLKDIPSSASRFLHLTQVDSDETIQQVSDYKKDLLGEYSKVVVSNVEDSEIKVKRIFHKSAGVILAAGGSRRVGESKQLLDWFGETIIRKVCKTAKESDLSGVIVVTGGAHREIEEQIRNLDIKIIENRCWDTGISSSIRMGLEGLPKDIEVAIFILADQPQISAENINSLLNENEKEQAPIIVPIMDGKRGNPVLFEKVAFSDLLKLEGDTGGKQLFSKYKVREINWNDPRLGYDIDTIEEYENLISIFNRDNKET